MKKKNEKRRNYMLWKKWVKSDYMIKKEKNVLIKIKNKKFRKNDWSMAIIVLKKVVFKIKRLSSFICLIILFLL